MTPRLLLIAGAVLSGCIVLLMAADTTPVQSSLCRGCGRAITERTRRPCPDCGSLNRHVTATADEAPIVFTDLAS